MNKLIIETVVKVDPNTIEVTASIAVRDHATDKKKYYRGADIAKLVTEYEVVETIEDPIIANTKRGNYNQRATWFFKIKKVIQNRAKAIPKPKIPEVVEVPKRTPDPSPTPTPKPTEVKDTQTKPSTKTSIRGRMSKIAKEKTNKNTKE
tara:strand:- start:770 stop:1216 length:447 start_codon:yes stop_codon:yes gene_type:complete